MDLGFSGKTVVVTGGSRGVGGGISEIFAREGANVVMDDLSHPEESAAYAKSLGEKYGANVYFVTGDISNPDDVKRVFDFAEEKTGSLDILVNCAGLTGPSTNGLIYEMPVETFKRNLDVNVVGTFMMSAEFSRRLIAAGRGGRIVNILSKASVSTTTPGHVCLAVSKAGLMGLTKQLAVELTSKGIIVNGIMPGSAMNSRFKGTPEELEDPKTKARLERLPMGRFAKPTEIGQMVAFLASDQCQLAVGSIVDATGGLLL
jgi:NAD(P)-dependent dehydrogenase (short-subunit alcohol dehydrogenase family)